MGELRLILLVAGALLVAGIWWWSRRGERGDPDATQAPRARRDLRQPQPVARAEPSLDAPSARGAAAELPVRVWEPKTQPETRRDDAPEPDGEPATVRAPAFDEERQMVLSLLVLPEHGERFLGSDVLAVLEECGLEFGAKRIFHRHEADGATLWSMANMLEPGYLEPAALQGDYVHGLVLFAVLPAPRPGSETFADMLATARRMAQRLHGELADADRSSLTPQTIQHLREQVLEFERRRAGAGA